MAGKISSGKIISKAQPDGRTHQMNDSTEKNTRTPLISRIGIIFIAFGALYLLDQYLHMGWLKLLILPALGLVFFISGMVTRRLLYLIPGSLLIGLGIGLIFGIENNLALPDVGRAGIIVIGFGLGWVLIAATYALSHNRIAWWAVLTAAVISAAGACLLFSQARVIDFTLYIAVAIGVVFLSWGGYARLLGLVIPGSLLITIGPGVYFGWSNPSAQNGLAQSGVMLVWFALGWILITVISRVITARFIWWPLIPGGILGMAGWGLYLGGNPHNGMNFVGNTGSIALIIIGVYLLLLRRGMQK